MNLLIQVNSVQAEKTILMRLSMIGGQMYSLF